MAPEGTFVRLWFQSFDIEHETECDYDYLEILDGDNYSAPVIGRYCGHQVSVRMEKLSHIQHRGKGATGS